MKTFVFVADNNRVVCTPKTAAIVVVSYLYDTLLKQLRNIIEALLSGYAHSTYCMSLIHEYLTCQYKSRPLQRQANRSAEGSYLEFKLGAAEVGPLLLPEVIRLDDESYVDAGGEGLLQDLQQRLDAVPLGAPHVNDDREAMLTHLLTGTDGDGGQREELT